MDRFGPLGATLRERFERVVFENEMMRAGFAAFPYVVLRDTSLSAGARLAYAVLLMYAWQEGACFAGQATMAKDVGVGERQLRNYLKQLEDHRYIRIQRQGLNRPNLYYILDVKTKLKKARNRGGAELPFRSGAAR